MPIPRMLQNYISRQVCFFLSAANAEIYCKLGVPFVMGTTGGDRAMLYETVKNSDVYAVISPQMGKQVHNKNLDLFSSIKNYGQESKPF